MIRIQRRQVVAASTGAVLSIAVAAFGQAPLSVVVEPHFDDPFLAENELWSVTVSVVGLPVGHPVHGVLGNSSHPWCIQTLDGSPFFNVGPDTPFSAGPLLEPFFPGATWDSGLLGIPGLDFVIGDPGHDAWAKVSGGGTGVCGVAMAWITLEPDGVPHPGGALPILRATMNFGSTAHGSFALLLSEPLDGVEEFEFEWSGPAIPRDGACWMEHTPPCPADLTGNGSVGVPDLLELLGQWGPCADPNDCPTDLTGSGTVGVPDLLALLSDWGDCPPSFETCDELDAVSCALAGGSFDGPGTGCD